MKRNTSWVPTESEMLEGPPKELFSGVLRFMRGQISDVAWFFVSIGGMGTKPSIHKTSVFLLVH